MSRFRSRLILAMFLVCGALLPRVIRADEPSLLDPTTPQRPVPIAVVTLSSIERVLENMDYIYASVDRPELSDVSVSFLSNVRDLKGVDRNRPLGMMIFLKPGILPTPDFVGFLPTDDFEELLQTLAIGANPAKVPDRENRYSLEMPNQTVYFERFNNDVFFAVTEELLDKELPDPSSLTKTLTTRYDLAAQLKVNAIPVGMRNVLLDFLRAAIEAESQQRDEEAESSYRVRKAYGDGNLRFVEQLLLQGDSFTIGLDVSPELKSAVIEMDLNARPGSEFAKYLAESGGKTSYFRPLQQDPAILSFSMSSQMDKESIEMMTEIVTQGKTFLDEAMAENPELAEKNLRLDGLMNTLLATIEAGQLDGFFRVQRDESTGEHTMLASVRVVGGSQSAQTIGDIFEFLNEVDPGDITLERNVLNHQGVVFHRVTPMSLDNNSKRIFGETWAMYFGAGDRTLWFALGGDAALPAVQGAIDKVVDPASRRDLAGTAPIQFSMSMSQWMGMWDNPDRGKRGMEKTMSDNFAAGQDRLIIDVTPKENGIRYRIKFEDAFLRAMGFVGSRQVDEMLGNPTDE